MAGPEQPIIEVRDLSYAVGGATILSDISFQVRRGEIFGIMGMSGSGKTTLLRLLMGLIRPASGEIIIEGQDIVAMDEDDLNRVRGRMGMCFQYAALFDSMTTAENVASPRPTKTAKQKPQPTTWSPRLSRLIKTVSLHMPHLKRAGGVLQR